MSVQNASSVSVNTMNPISNNAAAILSTNTVTMPEAVDDWVEFCDRHARASASDFAKAFCTYVSLNLPESAISTLSHRDFLRKFIDTFCEHFEVEYLRRSARFVANNFSTFLSLIIINIVYTFFNLFSCICNEINPNFRSFTIFRFFFLLDHHRFDIP